MRFRFVSKERLENVLDKVPRQSIGIPLLNYSLVYGQGDRDLRDAEERQRIEKNSRDYFELCRMGAFTHPTSNFARFPRTSSPYNP